MNDHIILKHQRIVMYTFLCVSRPCYRGDVQ